MNLTTGKKKSMTRLRALIIAAIVVLAHAAQGRLPAEGSRAPRFALRNLHDNTQLLVSRTIFENRHTLVSFFATWCKPCKEEIPHLARLEREYGDRGFQVVLVCLDRMGMRSVKDYLEKAQGSELLVLWDKFGRVSKQYAVVQLPTSVLVGPDEKVILAWEMYQPERLQQLEDRLRKLPLAPPEEPREAHDGEAEE
jgi:thiol-disulfide isomerase/thioredoxin